MQHLRVLLHAFLCFVGGLSSSAYSSQPSSIGCRPNLPAELAEVLTSADGGCMEVATGFVWSLPRPAMTFASGKSLCSGTINGRNDWSLPRLEDVLRLAELDASDGLRLGSHDQDLYWTTDVAARIDGGWEMYVSSLLDPDDFTFRRVAEEGYGPDDEEAAVICIRRSIDRMSGCAVDYDGAEFASEGGGCRHKRSGKTYSPVFAADTISNAQRICSRLELGDQRGWSLPTHKNDIEPLIASQDALEQIHNLHANTSLWLASVRVVNLPRETLVGPVINHWSYVTETYSRTINVSNGRDHGSIMERRVRITTTRGYPIDRDMPQRGGIQLELNREGVFDVSREVASYVCVRN